MRVRAAAALQKALTFQDVREGAAGVIPSAVAPLVELLKRKASTKGGQEIPRKRDDEEDVRVTRHDPSSQRGLGPGTGSHKGQQFKQGNKVL